MSTGHNHEARLSNYLFTIGKDRQLTFGVQSANINELTMGSAPFPTGAKDLVIASNKIDNGPLVIDFLVSQDYWEWVEVYKWMLRCKNSNTPHIDQVEPCSLVVLDSQNQPSTEFIYLDTFPIELTGVDHDVRVEDIDVVTATATLRFNQFKVIMPDGEVIDEQYYTS